MRSGKVIHSSLDTKNKAEEVRISERLYRAKNNLYSSYHRISDDSKDFVHDDLLALAWDANNTKRILEELENSDVKDEDVQRSYDELEILYEKTKPVLNSYKHLNMDLPELE